MNIKELLKPKRLILREVRQLQQSFFDMQVMLAQVESVGSTATGNPYKTYDSAIAELGKKYEGTADWGNYQARTIVDVRSAFIIGNGIQIVEKDPTTFKVNKQASGKHKKEMDFIQAFIAHNDLDEEGAQEYAKEAEIEGRILFKLIPNKDKKQIDLRFLSYATNKYKVVSNADDYKVYESVEYKHPTTHEDIKIKKEDFVYKKFAGRTDKVNDIMPKTATILRQIEDLDKALKDLRQINNLFASPTPHFNCEDEASAGDLYKKLNGINWKIGKLLVTAKAVFTLVSADASGVESIVKEITNLVKIISGVTGIPVHFLGLPDLMSNRSTSTDLFEMIVASTNKERKTWIGTYEEVFVKALTMANTELGTTFTPSVVSCDIPQVTSAKLRELSEIWLPLFQANVIDLDYMLTMIPDADPEKIKASQREEAKRILEDMKAQSDINPEEGGGGNLDE
jgi:hypothetical protein